MIIVMTALLLVVGCDSVVPEGKEQLVVEGWIDAGKPLPPIRIALSRKAEVPLSAPGEAPPELDVEMMIGGVLVPYERNPQSVFEYLPLAPDDLVATEEATFTLTIDGPHSSASASGHIPKQIFLEDVFLRIPDTPISAVLVDSLDIGLDSLNLAVNASTGYIYPVEVDVFWSGVETDDWIEIRLDPVTAFSSSLIDFFLLPTQVFPENRAVVTEPGSRRWSGVYAIPVPYSDSPLPEHTLRVTLLRGDQRFANYATSRTAPERREPVSNVNGGLGFVGGVSIDSIRVNVRK